MLYILLLNFLFFAFCSENSITENDVLKRPHIVFILADDMGWNDASFHGYKQVPTPNIDALALDGVILNKFYFAPACTPSRAALLTAKYPFRVGMQNRVLLGSQPWGLLLEEKLLPEYLKSLNYSTYGVGKWNLGHFKQEYLPMNRGFDSFFGFWTPESDYFSHISIERPTRYAGLDLHDNYETAWEYNGTYGTDLFTTKAKNIILGHDPNKPLFLYLAQIAPHSGNKLGEVLQATEEYVEPLSHIADENRRIYGGMVSALDQSVGEIFEALEQSGLLDDTIIVFCSDNGAPINGMEGTLGSNFPLRGGKYNLWEGGVRGLGFVWSSLLRKNSRVSNDLMHMTDWMPTLLSAAGYSDVSGFVNQTDGVDMWHNLLEGGSSPREELILSVDGFDSSEGYIWKNFKVIKGSYLPDVLGVWSAKDGTTISDVLQEESEDQLNQYEENYKQSLLLSKVANILQLKFGKNPDTSLSCQIPGCETFPSMERCGAVSNDTFPPTDRKECNIKEEYCLYDIENDPCEFNNIADEHFEIVEFLKSKIDKYRPFVPKNISKPNDPNGNPELHGGVWNPWM